MSANTETVKTCPHGHVSLRRRTGSVNATPRSEYYCKTCADKRKGEYHNPHYERHELVDKPRRVNEDQDYDVKMGYVWSPSHDE